MQSGVQSVCITHILYIHSRHMPSTVDCSLLFPSSLCSGWLGQCAAHHHRRPNLKLVSNSSTTRGGGEQLNSIEKHVDAQERQEGDGRWDRPLGILADRSTGVVLAEPRAVFPVAVLVGTPLPDRL